MAITQGVGPHAAWLTVNGQTFPVETGDVSMQAKRKSSSFRAVIPMSYPGARQAFGPELGDNEAVITVMTRGATAPLLTGEVDDTEFDYIARTINVTGRDKSAKLHDAKTSEKWINKKPSEIVQDLAGRVGLSGDIAAIAEKAGKKLEQDFIHLSDNVSFAYIIHKLAQFDGARWWVDATGQFHYQPVGAPQGIYSITVNQDQEPISADCIYLRVRRNVHAGKTIKATVKSWHPKLKKVFSYTSNVEGNGGPIEFNYHIPTLIDEHVKKHAKSQASERARHELTVQASVVGDTSVAPGMGLNLNGTDYDQTFDIDTIHHSFGMQGHRTSITARSAKQGRTAS